MTAEIKKATRVTASALTTLRYIETEDSQTEQLRLLVDVLTQLSQAKTLVHAELKTREIGVISLYMPLTSPAVGLGNYGFVA
ncbi:MAG TPA: hypothetical protein VGE93_04850 [Bryobacteraceae bacterium]